MSSSPRIVCTTLMTESIHQQPFLHLNNISGCFLALPSVFEALRLQVSSGFVLTAVEVCEGERCPTDAPSGNSVGTCGPMAGQGQHKHAGISSLTAPSQNSFLLFLLFLHLPCTLKQIHTHIDTHISPCRVELTFIHILLHTHTHSHSLSHTLTYTFLPVDLFYHFHRSEGLCIHLLGPALPNSLTLLGQYNLSRHSLYMCQHNHYLYWCLYFNLYLASGPQYFGRKQTAIAKVNISIGV